MEAVAAEAATTSGCPPTTGTVGGRVAALQGCASKEAASIQNMLASAKTADATLGAQTNSVLTLVAESDQELLREGGADLLAAQVGAEEMAITNALASAKASWPTARMFAEHARAVAALGKAFDDLAFESGWSGWVGKTAHYLQVQDLRQALADLGEGLDLLAPDGDLAKSYASRRVKLEEWKKILEPLKSVKRFGMVVNVECGFPFFKEKVSEYKIARVDRTISDASKNRSTQALAQVVCPSRFSVSAGIAATGIVEQDYGFVQVPGANGLESQITVTHRSNEQINPVALISARLGSLPWGKSAGAYGLHLSAGTVADYDNPDGGLKFGYVLGLSLSVYDHFLITGGVQGSRVGELDGGYQLDDPQPMGLTEVPVTNEWRFDWTLGLTYKLGGGN